MPSKSHDVQDNNSAEGYTANLSSVSSELTSLSGDKRPIPHINESTDSQRQSYHRGGDKSNMDPLKAIRKKTQNERINIIQSKTDTFCILEITKLHCRQHLH